MDSDLTKEVERLRLRIARQDMEISSIKVANDKLAHSLKKQTDAIEALLNAVEIIHEILKDVRHEGQ